MCQAHNNSINLCDHSGNKQHYPTNEETGVGNLPQLPNLTLLHTSGKLERLKSVTTTNSAFKWAQVRILALPLTGCVAAGRSPPASLSLSYFIT